MAESNKELSREKSEEQAQVIELIKIYLPMLDEEYLDKCSKGMYAQASRQESMAVLNPSHPQLKNDILRMKAAALMNLVNYKKQLIEVTKLEKQLEKEQGQRDEINRMFL